MFAVPGSAITLYIPLVNTRRYVTLPPDLSYRSLLQAVRSFFTTPITSVQELDDFNEMDVRVQCVKTLFRTGGKPTYLSLIGEAIYYGGGADDEDQRRTASSGSVRFQGVRPTGRNTLELLLSH